MSGEGHHIKYVPEPPSVRLSFVGWSAVGSLLLLVVSIGVLFGIYHTAVPSQAQSAPQSFPPPRVDTTESDELRRVTDAQSKQLEKWQWADGQHSTVQVPIERAMQLLAKKGADAYQPLLTSPQAALSPPTAAAERTAIQQSGTASSASDGASSLPREPNK